MDRRPTNFGLVFVEAMVQDVLHNVVAILVLETIEQILSPKKLFTTIKLL